MGVVSTHFWQVVHRWRFVDFILSPSTAFPFVMVPGHKGSKWFEGDGWPQLTFFGLDFNLFFPMFLLGLYDIGMFFSVNKRVPLWNSLKPLDLSRIRMGGFLLTPFAWRITPCTLPFGMFTKQSCWCIRDGSGQGISWPKLPVPSLTWNRVNLRIWRETELEKWPEFGLVKYYSLPRCVTDDTHDDLTKVFNLKIFKCFAKCLSISVGRLDWRCDSVRWDMDPPLSSQKMIISLVKLLGHQFCMEHVTFVPKRTFCFEKVAFFRQKKIDLDFSYQKSSVGWILCVEPTPLTPDTPVFSRW